MTYGDTMKYIISLSQVHYIIHRFLVNKNTESCTCLFGTRPLAWTCINVLVHVFNYEFSDIIFCYYY